MSYIIESSIIGSVLVGFILLIRFLIKDYMKKSIIYYLWFILIIKLLIPFGPESKLSLFNLINITSNEETNLVSNNYKLLNEELSSNPSNIINSTIDNDINLHLDNEIITNDPNEDSINKDNINFSYKEVLFVIWIIGVVIITAKILISYLKLKLNINKEYKEYKNYDLDIDISKEIKFLSIKRNIEVRITNEINSPSLCGIINPKILIPLNMINNINKDEMKYIVIHELFHYKRKDILVSWLTSIVRTIHWFNPIILFGLSTMRSDCESACDEMVLSKLDDNENIKYGNTIINVLHLINSKNTVPGTTSMVTNKKRIKDRIKSIAENKKFDSKTIFLGVIAIAILAVVVLTNRLSSENLNLVDSSSIKEVKIKVMPSSPKEKTIDSEEDIEKIVDYINSIKVKNKKKEFYKGWEVSVVLKGDKDYIISFVGNSINIDGIQYTIDNKTIENIKKLYNDLNYEENNVVENKGKNSNNNSYEVFLNKVNSDGYNIVSGSSFGGKITLPNELNSSSSIYEGYNKSLENGYNLEHYLGKEVNLISFHIDNTQGIQEIIGLLNDDILVGYWLSPIYNTKGESEVNKILNELSVKTVEDIYYITLIKYLVVNFDLKVEEASKNTLTTKDNGYFAESYTIKVNNEEVKIYEYNDERAALSEIALFNGDDYNEISYARDYILTDMEELGNSKRVYLKNKIICLYNGNNEEIKKALSSILEEPLVKLNKDKLRISEQDVTLIYPCQWRGMQEPREVVIGEETYKIDSNKIKQNKNRCEVKISTNNLLQRMRSFDEDELYIKWENKFAGDNNKTFLTKITRNDFIRVSQINGGYIDDNLVHPEIEINTNDKTLIGEKLYEEYIKMHSTNWFFNLRNGINKEPELSVSESKINDVSLISEGKNIFTVCISYDIKAANENSPWYAGNGVVEGNWIINKVTFLDIEKTEENKYRIINIYTG